MIAADSKWTIVPMAIVSMLCLLPAAHNGENSNLELLRFRSGESG